MDSQQPGRARADRGGPEADGAAAAGTRASRPGPAVAGAVREAWWAPLLPVRTPRGSPSALAALPWLRGTVASPLTRSPESGASSAIRAETMFDKTRLPYVALDVLCVLLGT